MVNGSTHTSASQSCPSVSASKAQPKAIAYIAVERDSDEGEEEKFKDVGTIQVELHHASDHHYYPRKRLRESSKELSLHDEAPVEVPESALKGDIRSHYTRYLELFFRAKAHS